jgi:5-(carboxyamino)imidazole ribonucleotide synthase
MISSPITPLRPGSVIGIMGGGQLGRMTALAAANLGYRTAIFTDVPDSPASQVCDTTIVAPYDDRAALGRFVEAVDVITFEFENIPIDSAEWLAERCLVRPHPRALAIAQDRALEKAFLNESGIATAPWAEIADAAQIEPALAQIGGRAVFKTARFGYDGKGQATVQSVQMLRDAWHAAGGVRAVLEGFIDFEREVSVIVARGTDGTKRSFDVVENCHANHILDVTIAPARVNADIAARATEMAEQVAEALDLVGLVAVEMFVTSDGTLLANEIAPRPHNSGHWTMDACVTSQFEQFARAVAGLPLGSPVRHSNAIMRNLIGDDSARWGDILADPDNKLHLYGKTESRPGRKMGHVNRLFPIADDWPMDGAEEAIRLLKFM